VNISRTPLPPKKWWVDNIIKYTTFCGGINGDFAASINKILLNIFFD